MPNIEPSAVPEALTGLIGMMAETTPHSFESEDGTVVLSLTHNFIAVEQHGYKRWEAFRKYIDLAIDSIGELYEIVEFKRVGLR